MGYATKALMGISIRPPPVKNTCAVLLDAPRLPVRLFVIRRPVVGLDFFDAALPRGSWYMQHAAFPEPTAELLEASGTAGGGSRW